MIPVVADADVVASTRHGAYRQLSFRHPGLSIGSRPGQFVNVATDPCHGMLRLPFSIAWTEPDTGSCTIVFDEIGDGTRWLAEREPGDRIEIVGPLGHGFEIGAPSGADLLIGGGYGTAALVGLATALADRGRSVHAILGARSADRLFDNERLIDACATTTRTTEDGSAGVAGRVTDVLDAIVDEHGVTTIYACGPNPMLGALASAGRRRGIATQLAVEEFMACGIGVCWTCVVPVETAAGRAHLRACTEGPVFDGGALAWT